MVSTTTSDAQSERIYTIYAVIKLLQHVSPPCDKEVIALLPDNGINSGSLTSVTGVAAAVQNLHFDHNGDLI